MAGPERRLLCPGFAVGTSVGSAGLRPSSCSCLLPTHQGPSSSGPVKAASGDILCQVLEQSLKTSFPGWRTSCSALPDQTSLTLGQLIPTLAALHIDMLAINHPPFLPSPPPLSLLPSSFFSSFFPPSLPPSPSLPSFLSSFLFLSPLPPFAI